VGAFPFVGPASKDAAFAALPVPGGYSIQLSNGDLANPGGTGLAEIYDVTSAFTADTPRLINLSARYPVNGPTSPLTAGFVVTGAAARNVLIRGIGPALAQFGVADALANPQVTLFGRGGTIVATNDDWFDAPNAVAIASTSAQVGAFALPIGSRDAALLLSLPAGSYTVQVSPANGSAGSALVEIYEVP